MQSEMKCTAVVRSNCGCIDTKNRLHGCVASVKQSKGYRGGVKINGNSFKVKLVDAFRGRQCVEVCRAAPVEDKQLEEEWATVAGELDLKSPLEIMNHVGGLMHDDATLSGYNARILLVTMQALETFGKDVAIAFSGAEDVALIEYAHLTGKPYRVFSLDTGRLNPETYQLFDEVEKHYGIRIEYTFPDTQEVVDLVREKGMFSFYEDGHQECCRVRKVRPLRKQLKGLKAWITGQRKDQSPGTRQAVPVVQVDPVFEGLEGGPGSLIKYNPLSNVSSAEVWNFLRVMVSLVDYE